MKFKTTRKEIMGGYNTVISVGYCDLQHLLRFYDPIAYTRNAGGWGADVYQLGSHALVTGYTPFGNLRPSYELVKEYEGKAEEVVASPRYSEQKNRLNELIGQFIAAVIAERGDRVRP